MTDHLAAEAAHQRVAWFISLRGQAATALAGAAARPPGEALSIFAGLLFVAQAVSDPYQRRFSPECDVPRSSAPPRH